MDQVLRRVGIASAALAFFVGFLVANPAFAETHQTAEMRRAIRYLNRVFKYDAQPPVDSVREIRAIARQFDPEDVKADPYLARWFEVNAKKLITESPNIEFVTDILKLTGMREKLIACSNLNQAGSMAWWLNKEPLPSFTIGSGNGKTAKELDISTAIHVPADSPYSDGLYSGAFRSITAPNSSGRPNVLKSRDNVIYESAYYGDGHYAKIGRGPSGTEIAIMYAIEPEARIGTDFEVYDGIIKFMNRNAITLTTCPMALNKVGFRPKASAF